MNRNRRRITAFEKLEDRRLFTLNPHLELDIPATPAPLDSFQTSELEAVGDSLYYTQKHLNYGRELWRVGPTGEPKLVKDIHPGQAGSDITKTTSVNDKLLFIANDDTSVTKLGSRLWVSDGTESGTFILSEEVMGDMAFAPGVFQNEKYFMRYESSGVELWKTDGTVAGTKQIYYLDRQNLGRDTQWAEYNGRLYFTFTNELWRTDGTTAGTVNDFDGLESTPPKFDLRGALAATSIGLFYRTSAGLWYSDGNSDSPLFLTELGENGFQNLFEGVQKTFEINGKYYYAVGGSFPSKLWQSDGTVAGTKLAIDLATLPAAEMQLAVQLNDCIVFAGSKKIWKFDGNSVTELGNPGSDAKYFRVDDGVAYFSFRDFSLWRTDGTASGTKRISNIRVKTPLDEVGCDWAMHNGTLYFLGSAPNQGYEIFAHRDGQADPVNVSHMFDRQKPFTNYGNLAVANNKAFFFVQKKRGELDTLYVYDSVTNKLDTIQKGWLADDYRTGVVAYKNHVYFAKANSIWKSDGTAEGTTLFSAEHQAVGVIGEVLFLLGDKQYFISDGTTVGTRPVNFSVNGIDLPFSPFPISPVYSAGNYWMNYRAPDSSYTKLLKTSDWVHFEEIKFEGTTGVFGWSELTPTPIGLFLHGGGGTNEGLWFASQTTARFLIPNKSPYALLGGALFHNNKLYFVGNTAENGSEPWYSDGTVAGTRMLLDINRGETWSSPTTGGFQYFKLGSKLLFSSLTASGSEWWVTNGTAAGTKIVDDITPGRSSELFSNTISDGDHVYFVANDHVFGEELWISDGTATGTYGLTDLMPGSGGSLIQDITVVGDDLLFLGSDANSGRAVWSLNRAQTLVRPQIQELLVYENSSVGAIVGKVEPQATTVPSKFAIKSGNEAGNFSIDEATGELKVTQSGLDFESQAEYLLSINQAVGLADVQVRIKVLDLNEPIILPPAVVFTVRNDVVVNKIVGKIPFSNPEKKDRVRFDFPIGTRSFDFQVDPLSGEIYVSSRSNFDTLKAVAFDVRVNDDGLPNASYLIKVVINFTDFNDPPVLASPLSSVSLIEEKTLVFPFEMANFVDPESEPMQFQMKINNQPLPSWIVYNSTSQTFTATPPVGTPSFLIVQIDATDSVGQTINTSFALNTKPFYRWYNYAMPLDSSRNGSVSPLDALLVINYLNSGKTRDVKNGAPDQVAFVDTSGDNLVSPLDALLVINFLNARADGEGESGRVEPFAWNEQFVGEFDLVEQLKKRSRTL